MNIVLASGLLAIDYNEPGIFMTFYYKRIAIDTGGPYGFHPPCIKCLICIRMIQMVYFVYIC